MYWIKQLFIIKTTLSRMDALFLMSIFQLYSGLKTSFEDNSVRKNLYLIACFCWDSRLFLREMDQKFKFGGTIGYGDSYLEFLFRHSKYLDYTQYYMMLLKQCGHIVVKDLATVIWLDEAKFLLAWSCDLTTLLPLRKILSTVHLHLRRLLKQYFFDCISYRAKGENIIKELGFFIDGSLQGFSSCPLKTFEPKKQTTWNTSQLHGIARSSGELDYERLFAVFYDIKVMNAEVFAKGLEKCGLLTTLVGKNVEILDDYGCPKIQDLVKTFPLPFPTQNQASLCREENKRVRRMGYATFLNFSTCLVYLCLLLI